MKTSEQVDKIFPAFIKAQAEFGKAIKDKTNPFFKSEYADLNAYLKGSATGLQENDLAVLQNASSPEEGQKITVSTMLIHSSGQWIESDPLTMTPTDMKPQSFGSAETYCRRYSLSSFLNMGTGSKEDDDGNRGSKGKPMQLPNANKEPKRAKVNTALLACTTPKEYAKISTQFTQKYGADIYTRLSGKIGDKNGETWGQLFETHLMRINGVPPINTKDTPEDSQAEFDKIASTCGDKETYRVLEKLIDRNKALNIDENWKIMDTLALAFGEE